MNPMKMLRDMRTIRELLTGAERIGRSMGDDEPAAEHLLLAAVDLPDNSARRVLAAVGVDREGLHAAVLDEHAAGLVAAGLDEEKARALSASPPLEPAEGRGLYRSRPSAQEAFQAAGALARSQKERLAGVHVVAAVAAMEHGTVARILDRLGVDRASLAAAADAERQRPRAG